MKRPGYKYILAFVDAVALNVAFALSLMVAGQLHIELVIGHWFRISPEVVFFALYSGVVIFIFQHNNLYKINVFLSGAEQIVKLGIALFYAVVGLAVLSFSTKSHLVTDSRLVTTLFYVFALALLVIVRVICFRTVFQLVSKIAIYKRNVLIVGAGKTGRLLAANLSMKNPYGIRIVGFVDDEIHSGTAVFMGARVLGGIADVHAIVKKHRVAEVLVALDDVSHERLLETVDLFRSRRPVVKVASPLYDIIPARIFTERYGDIPVTNILNQPEYGSQRYLKRLFDLLLTTTGVIILAPVFLAIAVAIKLDSRGPILFRQVRIGKGGKPFKFYKFRSMEVGSDRDEDRRSQVAIFIRSKSDRSSSTKIVNETRITRVGKFIRKTSLDELPQLFNVLRGEMSLVGPRPCLPYEWEQYENWHRRRLGTIPGCTGVWQVNGRSEVGFDDMVVLDLYYINNRSLLLDVQLILKTIPVMLFGKGAK